VDAPTSLTALFISSFLAATLLPGGSEAVLFGVLQLHPGELWPALAVATLGNTLGGMSSYLIGRLIPPTRPLKGLDTVRRWGSPALLLCVAAGWLRLSVWWSALFIAAGKFARYWVIAVLVV